MSASCGSTDTTPPTVLGVTPADETLNVALNATAKVTFNESMDDTTLTTSTFLLADASGSPVAGTITMDSFISAVFTPSAPLASGTRYTATLTTGIKDVAGNALASNYTWDFTTAAWGQVGGQVSADDAESEDPVMLLSTPFVGYRHASYQVALNQWNSSTSSWGTSLGDPSQGNFETFYGPPNFCDDSETIYVTYSWSGDTSPSGYDEVRASSWDATNQWQALAGGGEISYPGPNIWDGGEATIACRASTDPVVGWVEADNVSGEDAAAIAVVTPTTVSRSPFISRNNAVGSYATDVRVVGLLADASEAYLAQFEHDANNQDRTDLYVTQLALPGFAQTNLGGSLDYDLDNNTLSAPSMVMFGSDLVIAYSAYRIPPGGTEETRHIYVQRWDGATWSELGSMPVTAYGISLPHDDSNNPSLTVANGTLYLSWDETDGSEGGGTYIFIAKWDATNGQWVIDDTNKRISENVSNTSLDPSLGYNVDTGSLYVAFEETSSGWPQIVVFQRQL